MGKIFGPKIQSCKFFDKSQVWLIMMIEFMIIVMMHESTDEYDNEAKMGLSTEQMSSRRR